MKLTICELSYLHELILSCVNSITCMSLFRNQAQDEELKSILNTHFPIHVEDYNRKVEFVKDAETVSGKLNVPELNTSIFAQEITGTKLASPVTVNTNVTNLTDREIALSYFLTLKRAGKEYAIASIEATNPKLRQFLKDAYTMSCNHSFEVYEWMAKNNYYPLKNYKKLRKNLSFLWVLIYCGPQYELFSLHHFIKSSLMSSKNVPFLYSFSENIL